MSLAYLHILFSFIKRDFIFPDGITQEFLDKHGTIKASELAIVQDDACLALKLSRYLVKFLQSSLKPLDEYLFRNITSQARTIAAYLETYIWEPGLDGRCGIVQLFRLSFRTKTIYVDTTAVTFFADESIRVHMSTEQGTKDWVLE
jgi:hypothetical protein